MNDLADKKCIPCEGNIPPFNTEEIHKYLKKVDGWQVLEDKIVAKRLNILITIFVMKMLLVGWLVVLFYGISTFSVI